MFRAYNPFDEMIYPEPSSEVFPARTLGEQILIAVETGVSQSVPNVIAYDDEEGDYDPASNIRESRLDMLEFELNSHNRVEHSAPQPLPNGAGTAPDPAPSPGSTPAPPAE